MDNISTYFNAQEIANYADEKRKAEDPALWELLFPAESAPSLELKWIKSSRRKVMMLELSALDAHANRRGRLGAQKIIMEMPFFREMMDVSEKDRQELLKLMDCASDRENDIKSILSPIYDDHGGLVLGAYANADIMAGMLITGARIQIATDDQAADYNYDDAAGSWAATHVTQLTGTATWTAANKATSDPVGDIQNAIDAQEARGYKVARIIMNSATLKAFCNSDSIHKSVAPLGGVVKKSDARALLENETDGAEIIIYNRTYTDSAGNLIKVIPDNYVVLTGDGNLGRMYFGPTPEIFDKNHNKHQDGRDIATSQIDGVDCVGVECFMDNHPLVLNTVVSLEFPGNGFGGRAQSRIGGRHAEDQIQLRREIQRRIPRRRGEVRRGRGGRARARTAGRRCLRGAGRHGRKGPRTGHKETQEPQGIIRGGRAMRVAHTHGRAAIAARYAAPISIYGGQDHAECGKHPQTEARRAGHPRRHAGARAR